MPIINAFDELLTALSGAGIPSEADYPISELMAQSLFGHRLWVEASRRRERFLGVERVEMWHSKSRSEIWLNFVLKKGASRWRDRSLESVLTEGRLAPTWDYVRGTFIEPGGPRQILQQVTATRYGARPSDDLMRLIDETKPVLWRAITSSPPYRRYYLYLSGPDDVRLPQLASLYLLMFYLGSVTRYQPAVFHRLVESRYGPFVHEFLSSQPQQFLYGIACEFARREVSRAAVA